MRCVEVTFPLLRPLPHGILSSSSPFLHCKGLTSYLTLTHDTLTLFSSCFSCLPQQALPLQRRPTTCACPHTVPRTSDDIIHIHVPVSPRVKSSWYVLSFRLTLTMEHSRPLPCVIQSASESGPSEESRAAENVNTVSDLSPVLSVRGYLRHAYLGKNVSLTRRRQRLLAEFQITAVHCSTQRETEKSQLPLDVYILWLLADIIFK